MASTDITAFATAQLALLDAELQAEVAETSELVAQTSPATLQRAGRAILNLFVASQRTGLGGKTVVDLELDPAVGGGDLQEHGIRTGDIVRVSEQPSGAAKKKEKSDLERKGAEGVVVKVAAGHIAVALGHEDGDLPGGKLWLYGFHMESSRSKSC